MPKVIYLPVSFLRETVTVKSTRYSEPTRRVTRQTILKEKNILSPLSNRSGGEVGLSANKETIRENWPSDVTDDAASDCSIIIMTHIKDNPNDLWTIIRNNQDCTAFFESLPITGAHWRCYYTRKTTEFIAFAEQARQSTSSPSSSPNTSFSSSPPQGLVLAKPHAVTPTPSDSPQNSTPDHSSSSSPRFQTIVRPSSSWPPDGAASSTTPPASPSLKLSQDRRGRSATSPFKEINKTPAFFRATPPLIDETAPLLPKSKIPTQQSPSIQTDTVMDTSIKKEDQRNLKPCCNLL